ncbi:Basic-leucine zipper domain-containing protein [Artemisia annua]|uniref:Basic-leucine zipper domain-containing protein n=1 Tax=Artemisia annua TaxID=35608 RepID=A0A2U1MIA2_ARTAN|nr:Basic-leucine zipper domain-containing protein [Artemisia annua]
MLSSIFPSNDDHVSFSSFLDDIIIDFPLSNDWSLKPNSSSSGSDDGETNQWDISPIDHERKRKRMISNRESAKRSRMKKQKHLEDLKSQVSQYKEGVQELMNRLRFVNHNGQLVCRENERLRSESLMLQQKLCILNQLLVVPELMNDIPSAWPCNNNVTTINKQNLPSLITL